MTRPHSDQPPAHMPHPVSLAEFARRAKRNRSSVTRAFQGALRGARLPKNRADAAHPLVVAWAIQRGIEPASLLDPSTVEPRTAAVKARPKPQAPPQDTGHARSLPLDGLLDLSLRQITDRFGSQQGFSDFLDQRKKLADTLARELQIDRDRGALVPRAFIETHVIGLIDGTNRRLLSDVPRTLCAELYTLAKSGAPIEEAESATRKLIEKQLGGVKTRAIRAIAKTSKNSEKRGGSALPSDEERSPERDDTNR